MTKAVLDTNVLVSAAFAPTTSVPAQVVNAWLEKHYRLVVTPAIIDEYRRVFLYGHIRKSSVWTPEYIDRMLDLIAQGADIHAPGKKFIEQSRDPHDDKFLIAAFEAHADFLITGDHDLLVLNPFAGTSIVKPAQFLEIVKP